ncbi:MAG TPA: hypothetical protein VF898_12890, partial [Chloroflexota bacterium]
PCHGNIPLRAATYPVREMATTLNPLNLEPVSIPDVLQRIGGKSWGPSPRGGPPFPLARQPIGHALDTPTFRCTDKEDCYDDRNLTDPGKEL